MTILIDIKGGMSLDGKFPALIVGDAYYGRVTASGGTPFYTYKIVKGMLPAGLTLDIVTGEVTGTPTSNKMAVLTIRATDIQGMYVDGIFVIPCTTSLSIIPQLSRTWRYKIVDKTDSTDYRYGDDIQNWPVTQGPFGNSLSSSYPASVYDPRLSDYAQTLWPDSANKDIWIAQTVTIPANLAGDVEAVFFYDDTFTMYVNAVQVAAGWPVSGGHGQTATIAASAFVAGQNRIIARLMNHDGNEFAYFDMQWGMA